MKKKNKIYAFVAVLAATLTMLFANPTEAKAAELPNRLVTEVCLGYNSYEEPEETKVYYLKNSHGDIIGQVDESGNLLVSYSYNSFGELVAAVTFTPETANNRFLYAGEQYDAASGLYYLRARHYDAGAGRFTQEDTYLGDGRNLYAYTHSNPLKYTDPSGHATYDCIDDDAEVLDDWQEKAADGASTGKTYQTYTKTNATTGKVYSGRTSGTGSAVENVAARDANHHMTSQGYGEAQLDQSSSNYNAIRGREQMLIEFYGGAQSMGGNSGNAINGISYSNGMREVYLSEAEGEFGPIE